MIECGRRAEGQTRTVDTGIFSAVLYHLSYLGRLIYIKCTQIDCQVGSATPAGLSFIRDNPPGVSRSNHQRRASRGTPEAGFSKVSGRRLPATVGPARRRTIDNGSPDSV